jgi:putative colanic acid biosynthesis acetyltransferase WcaF
MPGDGLAMSADVAARQYRSELSVRNRIARACWGVVWTVFCRLSPRPFRRWRRFWLVLFGARLHPSASVAASARVWAPWNLEMGAHTGIGDWADCYCVDKVTLGEGAVVSQYAYICTASHDISDPGKRLVTKPITLGRMSWVCAGAYVNMGVTLGEGAVAAARAVVVKDVPPWTVVAGNPAKAVKTRKLRTDDEPEGETELR